MNELKILKLFFFQKCVINLFNIIFTIEQEYVVWLVIIYLTLQEKYRIQENPRTYKKIQEQDKLISTGVE